MGGSRLTITAAQSGPHAPHDGLDTVSSPLFLFLTGLILFS